MLSCREVSELVSESLDHRISWWQRMNLWMHLSMCKFCWRFRKDVVHLDKETRRLVQEAELNELGEKLTLSAQARDRLLRSLSSEH